MARDRTWLLLASLCAIAPRLALAGVQMHNPRGSNNKLSEQSNLVENPGRLFDSQNSPRSGYQVGDNCTPACQNAATAAYDPNQPGAMEGRMYYYQGSELYIEWNAKHGCGVSKPLGRSNPSVICQEILQYMCDDDNPNGGVGDGTTRGAQNTAGGTQEPPDTNLAPSPALGQHESVDYYLKCKARERNKGLYTADQVVAEDQGATATRQNPLGNTNAADRHGLECPEERDYYPYWHPTPWHDIAILTTEPEDRCQHYWANSQNTNSKGECSEPQFNNPQDCEAAAATWETVDSFGEWAPECTGAAPKAQSHHHGEMRYYMWKIPDSAKGKCVLRLRYNITPGDFGSNAVANSRGHVINGREVDDYFFVDSTQNSRGAVAAPEFTLDFAGGPPILPQDPISDFLDLGDDFALRLNVHTDHYGRTFEDRSHTFEVREVPSQYQGYRIVNYNVRGRRGDAEDIFPSVDYAFVPPELKIDREHYLHFQWTGSDANALENAGKGRQGTDRSNLLQVADRGENVPLPISSHTLLFDGDPENAEARSIVRRFAFLDQVVGVADGAAAGTAACDPAAVDPNALNNCQQLNAAPAYFDGGLVQVNNLGEHHILCTRNTDFGAVHQRATITVIRRHLFWLEIFGIVLAVVVGVGGIGYLGVALYAYRHPRSILFSKRYRPRILAMMAKKETIEQKEEDRREAARHDIEELRKVEQRTSLKAAAAYNDEGKPEDSPEAAANRGAAEYVAKPWSTDKTNFCMKRCSFFAGDEAHAFVMLYHGLNIFTFWVGAILNWNGGFQEHFAFEVAKGTGYVLDLNLAILILPTLKTLQTALRGTAGGHAKGWIPMDEPIELHMVIARTVGWAAVIHTIAHVIHAGNIHVKPTIQSDPLGMYNLDSDDKVSGRPVWVTLAVAVGDSVVTGRAAGYTGIILVIWFGAIFFTAWGAVRRGTSKIGKRLGGFKAFWRMHMTWKYAYLMTLLHSPQRLWIWFFFPFFIVMIDRILHQNQRRPWAGLVRARSLPGDVLNLQFERPLGWSYQAGQYIRIFWAGEWHPFTLTSAPEEKYLSLHIKSDKNLDWCYALRKFLTIEAPHIARGTDGPAPDSVPPWTAVEYRPCVDDASRQVFSRPCINGEEGGGDPDREDGDAALFGRQSSNISLTKVSKKKAELPPDAVVMKISGPYGAPAMRVFEFDTIMVVGSGIGVTPFASICRSVALKAQQRAAIIAAVDTIGSSDSAFRGLEAAEKGTAQKPSSQGADEDREMAETPNFMRQWHDKRSASRANFAGAEGMQRRVAPTVLGSVQEEKAADKPAVQEKNRLNPVNDLKDLVSSAITYPGKIYFYWIIRSQTEFDWFSGLLTAALQGPTEKVIEINIFFTGQVDLSKAKTIPGVKGQFTGRPVWGRLFGQVKSAHKGEHVGVFLCGNKMIGAQLSEQSQKNSDAPGTPNGTKFSFFAESF